MPSFLNLAARFRNWRHKRGFGIHSPFAFRFITEVLCLPSPYGYYSYTDISDSGMRVLFRVTARFNPSTVAFIGDDRQVRHAVFAAVPKARPTGIYDADFVVFDARSDRKLPADAIPPSANAVILNYRKWRNRDAYFASLPAGMTFSNGSSMCVVAALPHLPRQDFDVSF